MEIVLKRIYAAHTKHRIDAKPADLGRSSQGPFLPLLGNEDCNDDIKNKILKQCFHSLGGGNY